LREGMDPALVKQSMTLFAEQAAFPLRRKQNHNNRRPDEGRDPCGRRGHR